MTEPFATWTEEYKAHFGEPVRRFDYLPDSMSVRYDVYADGSVRLVVDVYDQGFTDITSDSVVPTVAELEAGTEFEEY